MHRCRRPRQHAQVADPEEGADHPGRERHGRQVQEAEGRCKGVEGRLRGRQIKEPQDRHRAQRIDHREQVLLDIAPTQHAPGIGAENVEQGDQRQRSRPHVGRKAAIADIGGKVRRDEHDVKSAYEVAGEEQAEITLGEGLANRLADRLVAGARSSSRRLGQGGGHRNEHQRGRREREERTLPPECVDERLRVRDEQELAEGTRRGRDRDGAIARLGRHVAPDDAEDHAEGHGTRADAAHDTDQEDQRQRGGRIGHRNTADDRQDRAGQEHAAGADPVGDGAGEGLR